MELKDIIYNCPIVDSRGSLDTEISRVESDSRKVKAGDLFVAINGYGADGRDYIDKAIEAGAVAVLGEGVRRDDVVSVDVSDSREALAQVAHNFYGSPSSKLKLVGITGTNGKTTTVTLLYKLFTSLGHKCGMLSTIANYVADEQIPTLNTTSDPLTTNALLSEMVQKGCEYCFMEVSSIGVDQKRVFGLDFAVGIFSNLTHDHLDYHKTFAKYLSCKQKFFTDLAPEATAITNLDDRNGRIIVQNTRAKVMSYSLKSASDHKCKVLEKSFEGMLLQIDGTQLWTRLTGTHNAYNLLSVYCTALALGVDKDELLVKLSAIDGAKGRLETISGPRGLNVVIDYAHTPDALENVLRTLRDVAPERELVCLFGCGGDRDKTKRPEMAAIAEKLSDRIIITSDNSRTEDTESIMQDIREGLSPVGLAKAISIADRREAIRAAIMFAPQGATILLAGKGHEDYQIIGKEKRHFDEKEIVEEIFKTIGR